MDFGVSVIPWRSGSTWRGEQSASAQEGGGARDFLRIVGGYVTDREIRTFPGWRCILDPVEGDVGEDGYLSYVVDAVRPVAAPPTSTSQLRERLPNSASALAGATFQTMRVWARPKHFWSLHRIRDKHVIVGESGLRIEPIIDRSLLPAFTPVKVTRWQRDGSGKALLTFTPSIAGAISAGYENSLDVNQPIYIDGLVDANTADAARLNGRVHLIDAISAGTPYTVRVTTTVAADSASSALVGNVGRVRGNMAGVTAFSPDGVAPYGETDSRKILDDESLTAYWIEDPFDVDSASVAQKVYPSYVANRQRDFGDHSSDHPDTRVAMHRMIEGHVPSTFTGGEWWGVPRRRTMRCPHRGVSAVSGDRVLLAVPGYGCLFQIPNVIPGTSSSSTYPTRGAVEGYNTEACRPRSLGVPKAEMLIPNAANGGTQVGGRADSLGYLATGGGTVYQNFAVAYRDDVTGEIGQLSEVWKITMSPAIAPSMNVALFVKHPGYALAETMALSIMVYASKPNETALAHIATVQLRDLETCYTGATYINGASASSVYGLSSTTAAVGNVEPLELYYRYTLPVGPASTPSLFNSNVELPEQRTMPRGGSWVRTVRGVPLSGGSIGTVGAKSELQQGAASIAYDATNSNQPNEIALRRYVDSTFAELDQWPMVGNGTIPSSYGGMILWSRTLLPHPMEFVILDRIINSHCVDTVNSGNHATTTDERLWQRWRIIENPHRWNEYRTATGATSYLVLPRGQIQIHEPGLPSVSLAQGKQLIDANKDEDSVAAGEYRGIALIFTQRHTYTLQWNQGPAGTYPILQSSVFGCVAPNAVVEHDGGTVWLSDRGLCEWNGQAVSWVGWPVERWFRAGSSRFLRDSTGMMRQAIGFWDESRGIAMFGVTENRSGTLSITRDDESVEWDDADDKAKGRFPCDTVLAYNPRLQALSEWHPPSGLEPLWFETVACTDGVQRPAFLAADGRVYAMDDHFGDGQREPALAVASSAGTSATTVTTGHVLHAGAYYGSAYANRGGRGTLARAGADVVIYNPTTLEIAHRSTVASANGAGAVVMGTAGTWAANDIVAVGCRSMTLETTYLSPKGTQAARLEAVTLSVRLTSGIQHGYANAERLPAWVKVTATVAEHASGRHGGGADRIRTHTFHRNPLGDPLGQSVATDIIRTVRLNHGKAEGVEIKVTVEVFGQAHVAIQDLRLEIA